MLGTTNYDEREKKSFHFPSSARGSARDIRVLSPVRYIYARGVSEFSRSSRSVVPNGSRVRVKSVSYE